MCRPDPRGHTQTLAAAKSITLKCKTPVCLLAQEDLLVEVVSSLGLFELGRLTYPFDGSPQLLHRARPAKIQMELFLSYER